MMIFFKRIESFYFVCAAKIIFIDHIIAPTLNQITHIFICGFSFSTYGNKFGFFGGSSILSVMLNAFRVIIEEIIKFLGPLRNSFAVSHFTRLVHRIRTIEYTHPTNPIDSLFESICIVSLCTRSTLTDAICRSGVANVSFGFRPSHGK